MSFGKFYRIWESSGPPTRLRAKLVENDISEVVDEVQELSSELNIPIKSGSINEKIVGRELLRATAAYYEECADRVVGG